jgi:hypothetical protein
LRQIGSNHEELPSSSKQTRLRISQSAVSYRRFPQVGRKPHRIRAFLDVGDYFAVENAKTVANMPRSEKSTERAVHLPPGEGDYWYHLAAPYSEILRVRDANRPNGISPWLSAGIQRSKCSKNAAAINAAVGSWAFARSPP